MEIRSIAIEVAKCFEGGNFQRSTSSSTITQKQQKELPTSITIYHTGRILYSYHNSNNTTSNNSSAALSNAFDNLLTCLPKRYVCDNCLHEIHFAYMSMLVSYAKQRHTLVNPLAISIDSHSADVETVSYEDIIEATESLCGIYLASNTVCHYCCFGLGPKYEELELVFVSLSWVYDNCFVVAANNNNNNSNNSDTNNGDTINNSGEKKEKDAILLQKSILQVLSRLLSTGIRIGQTIESSNNDEQLSYIMTLIQNIQSSLGEYSIALGDMLDLVVDVDNNNEEYFSSSMLISKFHDNNDEAPPQLNYLLAILRASPRSKKEEPFTTNISNLQQQQQQQTKTTSTTPSSSNNNSKGEGVHSLLDEQIDQIKSILPTLGEGYIEEALKCYNHDVDQTFMALLDSNNSSSSNSNSNIHPRLLSIPTNLPRKLRNTVDKYSVNVNLHRGNNVQKHNDGKEFVALQKEYIKQNERIAEEEAYLIEQISRNLVINEPPPAPDSSRSSRLINGGDEYNDEYDDQYDGIGGDAGGGGVADVGLYDVDNNDYNPYAQKQQQYSRYSVDHPHRHCNVPVLHDYGAHVK